MAQIVYYVTGAAGGGARRRPGRRSRCPPATSATCSPAGCARRMGVPIAAAGRRQQPQRHPHPLLRHRRARSSTRSCPTLSPSMDIQVSSNLERLLFELLGRDGAATAELMAPVPASGRVGRAAPLADCRRFGAGPARRRRDARQVIADVWHGGPATWSTPTPRSASAPPRRLPARPEDGADGVPGHRAPGQVPRRGRAGHRASGPRCPTRLADLFDRPERYDVARHDLTPSAHVRVVTSSRSATR